MALTFDASMIETDEGLLNGIIIELEIIEDNFEKAIARYDYPYADGADLEDMGQKAHTIRFRCWFWDDESQQSYDTHTLLLDSLKEKALLDFVHPKYGLLKGKIETISVQHNDAIRTATIDLTFVEQMRQALSVAPAQSVESAVAEAYVSAQAAQESILLADIVALLPAADAAAVTRTLIAGQAILGQLTGYTNAVRTFVQGAETRLAEVEAAVNQIVNPANTLQATMNYGATLPGRLLGNLSRSLEKYGTLHSSLRTYPALYISRISQAFDEVDQALATFPSDGAGVLMRRHYAIACAQRLALEAAAVYAADADAAAGMNPDVQPMIINELESTLAVVRARLSAALEEDRAMEDLKIMAAALLTQVNAVRLQREKMIAVVLDNPLPLHLVCLRYGLPYQDAERLLRVNRGIRHPNFAAGEVMVYAT